MDTRYYVCLECAHFVCEKDRPPRCENCGVHGSNLRGRTTAQDAEMLSEKVMRDIDKHGGWRGDHG